MPMIVAGQVMDVESRVNKKNEVVENIWVACGRETIKVWGVRLQGHEPEVGASVAYEVSHYVGDYGCQWRRLGLVNGAVKKG